ncbi:site-specific integrase [uncultured Umboniibacter sp.]|uniref:site-specific integrase n=1 Tax=uncultured Umboniibacter sp. TaxID=1798917 RepID=UPI0026394501|nr:site-specific integrase [uncultured Umboniibacter sp.]
MSAPSKYTPPLYPAILTRSKDDGIGLPVSYTDRVDGYDLNSPRERYLVLARFLLQSPGGEPLYSKATQAAYRTEVLRWFAYIDYREMHGGYDGDLYLPKFGFVEEYLAWLKCPPREYIGSAKVSISHPDYKLFHQSIADQENNKPFAVSPKGVNRNVSALSAFYLYVSEFIEDIRPTSNPFRRILSKQRKPKRALKIDHVLESHEVDAIRSYFSQEVNDRLLEFRLERERWLFLGLLHTGLRRAEFMSLRHEDVRLKTITDHRTNLELRVASLNVLRKGGGMDREEHICSSFVCEEFHRYVGSLSAVASNELSAEAVLYSLPSKNWKVRPLQENAIDFVFAQMAGSMAEFCKGHPEYKHCAERIAEMTPHWLRHTAITKVANTQGVVAAKDFANHASLNTTTIYTTTKAFELAEAGDELKRSFGL